MRLAKLKRSLVLVGLLLPVQGWAYTTELCEADVLHQVPSMSVPSGNGTLQPIGQQLPGSRVVVTELLVMHVTGQRLLCWDRGGACYPATVSVDGKEQLALRLRNCAISTQPTRGDVADSYATVLDEARTDPQLLKESKVEERLMSEHSLCHACAGNAAAWYVHRPDTVCGRLVAATLAGEQLALSRLQNGECDRYEAAAPGGEEAVARAFLMRLVKAWSGSIADADAFYVHAYAPMVMFYGGGTPAAKVVKAKHDYALRWPVRRFDIDDYNLKVTCDGGFCTVTGMAHWDYSAPARSARSIGDAEFTYIVDIRDGVGSITSETGRVLSRLNAQTP